MSCFKVFEWHHKFKDGSETLEDGCLQQWNKEHVKQEVLYNKMIAKED
jgi:hypothetical protein